MDKKFMSEHIFLFPFTWKYLDKKESHLFLQHMQLQKKVFDHLDHWIPCEVCIETEEHYNEFVYFYKPIRSALYTFPNAPTIVRNYKYDGLDAENYFKILVGGKCYELGIMKLTLKLYKTGIGILSFYLRNDKYETIESIEAINSFSKCIYPPILPLDKAKEELFPDAIEIKLNNAHRASEFFTRDYCKEGLCISPLIMSILGKSFCNKQAAFRKGSIYVEPILGNQMFCLCLYENPRVVKEIQEGTVQYDVLERMMTLSKKVSYHEPDDIPGHVGSTYYLKNESSVYGMSRFALLCVVSKLPNSKLYDQLVSLVLMQRATLLSLSTEIARVSSLSQYDLVPAIASLYEIYIQFINQLYFKEVTEDAQGAHIYEKLSVQLKIQEELEQLDFEIDEVHEYASLVEQAQSKLKMDLLTIIGAALVLPSFVTSLFGMNILQDEILHWWDSRKVALWMNSYVFLPIFITVVFCTWNKRKTKGYMFLKVVYMTIFFLSILVIYKYGCGL